jgi:uncharacterized protein YuzE
MKLRYHRDTDSLYINLVNRPGADTIEVAPGIVVDVDAAGDIVGIDLDHASRFVDEEELRQRAVPIETQPN